MRDSDSGAVTPRKHGFNTPRKLGLKRWFKAEWHQPLLTVGAVLGLLSGVTDGWWQAILVAPAVAATVVGGVRSYKHRSELLDREDELAEAEEQKQEISDRLEEVEKDLFDMHAVAEALYWALLAVIADELDLGNAERISVYVHDGSLNSFQMLARHSKNPRYEAPGRTVYADNVGVIGHAWVDGVVIATGLPEWDGDGRAYAAANLERFGLPESECKKLKMKSRSLIGVRYPTDEAGSRPLGVLVVESTDPDWASDRHVMILEGSRNWRTLRDHLNNQRNELPLLSGAKRKGF